LGGYHKDTDLNIRQQKITEKFFSFGEKGLIESGISPNKYQYMTKCSSATATRNLKVLIQKSILIRSQSGGRSLRYHINLIEEKTIFNVFPKRQR